MYTLRPPFITLRSKRTGLHESNDGGSIVEVSGGESGMLDRSVFIGDILTSPGSMR